MTAGNWLFTSELLGNRRVSREVRPRKPESALISRRAESWSSPSASRILGPTMPALGFFETNVSRCSKKLPSTTVSGFMKTTGSPSDVAMPVLLARANPTFSLFRIRRTPEGRPGDSTLSLSTTTISKSPWRVFCRDSMQRRVKGQDA